MLAACRGGPARRHRRLRARPSPTGGPDEAFGTKMKKARAARPTLTLVENPDILATLAAAAPHRPRLVVGFAAETNDVEAHARAKLARKGCDWIVANDVTEAGVMGGDENARPADLQGQDRALDAGRQGSRGPRLAQRIAATSRSEPLHDRTAHPPSSSLAARREACPCPPTRPTARPAWTCGPRWPRTRRWC